MLTYIKSHKSAAGIAAFFLIMAASLYAVGQPIYGQPTEVIGVEDGLPVTIAGKVGAVAVPVSMAAPPAGTGDVNLKQVNGATVAVGSGVELTAQRVTIATDSTGVLSVDDNGSTLSVDGTVAVSSIPAITGAVTATVTGTVTALDPVCTAWETSQYAIPATGAQFAVGTLANRDWLRVTNSSASASSVFCGKTGLTTANGERLDVSEGRKFQTGTTQLYCLTTAPGTATLTTFECDQ